METSPATTDYSDTKERFLEVWRKFKDHILDSYEMDVSFYMQEVYPEERGEKDTGYDRELHGHVFPSYDSLSTYVRRQHEVFRSQEEAAMDDDSLNDNWMYDEAELDMEVHSDIIRNAEEYYRDGWDLTEPLLKKMVRENLGRDRQWNTERSKFSSDDWRKGWLILRFLDSKTTGGTKADQLLWLRNALVYNDTFNIFATKEAYGRGMEYEKKLSSTFPKNERIVVGPWGGK